MADILRTTQPVGPGFENNPVKNQPLTPPGSSVENAPNPSRVMNPDGKTEQEDGRFSFLSNSNYETFVRELKGSQGLSETLGSIVFSDLEAMAATGKDVELVGRLASFMELISMEEGDLLPFVKNQAARSNEFGEPFFRAVKDVFDKTSLLQLKTAVLRASGKFGDMAAANHTIKEIITECRSMLPYLFPEEGKELKGMIEKLRLLDKPWPKDGPGVFAALSEHFDQNKQVILKELIPFFSDYIKKTHDMGIPREKMLLITDQAARYLNGSPKEVLDLFSRLLTYGEVSGRLEGIQADHLMLILGSILKKRLDGEDHRFTEELCSLVEAGLKSGRKEQFFGAMNAMLRNDSVYLPLMHLLIPIRLGHSTLFSELWIDPEAEGKNSRGETERGIRMLMKMEIKGLGAFDLLIGYGDRQVDVRILFPPALRDREKEIRTAVGAIAVQNGLTPGNVQTEVRHRPLMLLDVFPKIKKRKDSVNVRV